MSYSGTTHVYNPAQLPVAGKKVFKGRIAMRKATQSWQWRRYLQFSEYVAGSTALVLVSEIGFVNQPGLEPVFSLPKASTPVSAERTITNRYCMDLEKGLGEHRACKIQRQLSQWTAR